MKNNKLFDYQTKEKFKYSRVFIFPKRDWRPKMKRSLNQKQSYNYLHYRELEDSA